MSKPHNQGFHPSATKLVFCKLLSMPRCHRDMKNTSSSLLCCPFFPIFFLCTRTYQILDHDFNLFLSHIHIFCRSFQSDFILSFSEFDVNLERQGNKSSKIHDTSQVMLLVRPIPPTPAIKRCFPSHKVHRSFPWFQK